MNLELNNSLTLLQNGHQVFENKTTRCSLTRVSITARDKGGILKYYFYNLILNFLNNDDACSGQIISKGVLPNVNTADKSRKSYGFYDKIII